MLYQFCCAQLYLYIYILAATRSSVHNKFERTWQLVGNSHPWTQQGLFKMLQQRQHTFIPCYLQMMDIGLVIMVDLTF